MLELEEMSIDLPRDHVCVFDHPPFEVFFPLDREQDNAPVRELIDYGREEVDRVKPSVGIDGRALYAGVDCLKDGVKLVDFELAQQASSNNCRLP